LHALGRGEYEELNSKLNVGPMPRGEMPIHRAPQALTSISLAVPALGLLLIPATGMTLWALMLPVSPAILILNFIATCLHPGLKMNIFLFSIPERGLKKQLSQKYF